MNVIAKDKTKVCFHCGDNCLSDALIFDGKDFCCPGCQLVYELLQDNGLSSYYEYGDSPGTKKKNQSQQANRFDFLSDQTILEKMVDFQNEEEAHVSFSIPAIHCASCIWLLENLHQLNPGVISGRVDFVKKVAQFRFLKREITLQGLVELLAKIGYEPTIRLSNLDKKSEDSTGKDKSGIYKLAVAGFCFGNMMFFSLPDYFSETSLLGEGFRGLFAYLNIFLALPVVFYAAADYYKSAWYSLKSKRVNMDVPIVLGIITLFTYSLYEILIHQESGYMDSLGGLLFFLLLGKLYQQKTFATLAFDRDYKAYFPLSVTLMNKGAEEVVALTKIQEGDLIKVRNEELIPCDSVLFNGDAQIDYSFVTGEEVPVKVPEGKLIYAGGRQKGAELLLEVQKLPSQGYLTSLWNHKSFHQNKDEEGLASLANAISGKFTFTVLLVAFLALGFWSFYDLPTGIKAFTSVLIVACPCALALSTPFTLGNTLRVMGNGKFYLKNGHVIENLAEVDSFVLDKTGTLTNPNQAKVSFKGEALSPETLSIIKSMVSVSNHPLSNRIRQWIKEEPSNNVTEIKEWTGKGILAKYKSMEIKLGSAKWLEVENGKNKILGNQVYLAIEGKVMGYFSIQSGLRKGMPTLVTLLKEKGKVHLLSGDQNHERKHLEEVFGSGVSMLFQQSPKDKLKFLEKLNGEGKNTLMMGDGLNDSGALQESKVGIALTDQATHFSPASDAILDATAINKLPAFIEFAKVSRKIIKGSFILSFVYNALGIGLAVQGLLSPVICAVLMPLSSISVVVFTTISTNYWAYKKGLITKKNELWK
ncbi:heavy metal translocating P-type ATPase metal-binding domain-containing protein [Echinicola jeungdonensis]|uniref:Heavy metal translocating P-type ATPase n=1 Tax=Echinicola jeungdonensis TaxID=709343 RepID=A0ABV5J0R6_9BACT|nr:heavy metal translocating P-type ATPase metal-binding domain-containing protein [Echinicola jeungdonensis]MDN3667791.1 heavy metal translocating P-type ATPase metal-binding domain-containing protein [Echinicola jeungdonensis]